MNMGTRSRFETTVFKCQQHLAFVYEVAKPTCNDYFNDVFSVTNV